VTSARSRADETDHTGMRVGVLGTGHVGLVTCLSLAAAGHRVVGTDTDIAKIGSLRDGRAPFFEPRADELLGRCLREGSLSFSEGADEAVSGADVAFICVGTPPRANGEANMAAVEDAAREVARAVDDGALVVVEKSTVPAGTADRIKRTILLERPELETTVEIVSNPEFLREGSAVDDALQPDRILVGAGSDRAFETMRRLYAPFIRGGTPLIETDITTAELAKHACNAFLALKISYSNALARLCERAGGDVNAVADVMGADPRIGRRFLNAGLGYGGYCFPKDLVAFQRLATQLGYDFGLLSEVSRINDEAIDAALEKIGDALWNLEGKRVALLGLAFKPGTDDVRFSPAMVLAERLLERGANVVGYDPQAGHGAANELEGLELAENAYEAARDAHCVVVCTDWEEFRELDLTKLAEVVAYPVLVDGRNLLDGGRVTAAGFTYYAMGKRPMIPGRTTSSA
jgi:UDPglucose 6-dehydrogenase